MDPQQNQSQQSESAAPQPASQNKPEPTATKPEPSRAKEVLSTIGIIIAAPLLALFLTNFVFQTYQVDGPSMNSTLQDKDRLIVVKTGKTLARITGKDYIPSRYEIVIFNHTGEFADSQFVTKKQLIKRVIALPGERVVVKDGIVKVYNQEHPDGFLVDREGPESKVIGNTNGSIDEVVKAGQVYVMGDNRENSLDSRSFGAIQSDDLVGHLVLRIYPLDKFQSYS